MTMDKFLENKIIPLCHGAAADLWPCTGARVKVLNLSGMRGGGPDCGVLHEGLHGRGT
jgi:hypothetical protein